MSASTPANIAAWASLHRSGIKTGLVDLDSLTHGLLSSSLWVVTGFPGAGRSMLAAQLARRAALAGLATSRFITGRDHRHLVLSYWLAGEARVPLHHLLGGDISPEEATRLEGAQRRLDAAPLAVWTEADDEWVDGECHSTASFRHEVGSERQRARVIVADDVDVMLGAPLLDVLQPLRDWTRRADFTLIVTVPADQVLAGGRLLPGVAREADAVLHCRGRACSAGTPAARGAPGRAAEPLRTRRPARRGLPGVLRRVR